MNKRTINRVNGGIAIYYGIGSVIAMTVVTIVSRGIGYAILRLALRKSKNDLICNKIGEMSEDRAKG